MLLILWWNENEIVNIIASSQNTRAELLSSYQDTKFQRKIISDRLDVINFSADSLVNSYTEELSLLENILETEINLLHGYFLYLHQNKMLMGHIGVKPWKKKKVKYLIKIIGSGGRFMTIKVPTFKSL